MKPLATVLYEDSKIGKEFPLHNLLMRMVEDDIDGQTWRLRKLVLDNPRNGIDNVLADVRATSLIAGPGIVFVLADRDRIVQHLNRSARSGETRLEADASDDEIADAILARSDAPRQLRVFMLQPNMEGLITAIEACVKRRQLADEIAGAKAKNRIMRDLVLTEVAREAMQGIRACVRERQPGLDALAKAIGEAIPREAIA